MKKVDDNNLKTPNCPWCKTKDSPFPNLYSKILESEISTKDFFIIRLALEKYDPDYQNLIAESYCCKDRKNLAIRNYIAKSRPKRLSQMVKRYVLNLKK